MDPFFKLQFRESWDATCVDENMVTDEGDENMIKDEATDEEGYVSDTELSDTSMGNISADWTPLKYQLGSDLNSISKKLRQRVVKKASNEDN